MDFMRSDVRKALASLETRLFRLWQLPDADQLELLGLNPANRRPLARYAKGSPLPANRDVFDRAGWLLSIHKSLGLLYPRNADLRYSWVRRRNKVFDNLAPIDIIKEQGMIGMAKVARYLDMYCGV